MKLGITVKLFLAILATSLLVGAAVAVGERVSFFRDFLGYLNEQELDRLGELVPDLATAYRRHGSWEFLRNNIGGWFDIIRPPPPGADVARQAPTGPPTADLTGVLLRAALLDAQRRVIVGNPRVGADALSRPILVDGRTVGWLAVIPFERVSVGASAYFAQRQRETDLLIAAVALPLTIVVALLLAHRLLAPLKRIADATHRVAAGDYASPVPVTSGDEIGRLAMDFNRLALSLENTERTRRAFMADVSHELRTPLAVLRGELEAIEDGVRRLTPESLASLLAEVAMLSRLVDDLYDLSLSDAGRLVYRKIDVDACGLLAVTLNAKRDRLAECQIRLERDLPGQAIIVLADEARLLQVFGNLVENSLRYTDAGGLLRVTCRPAGAGVEIDFEDSAPGVPEALIPRLFERFFRAESSRNRATGGAGLGLAICRNIVAAHGGRIRASASALGGLRIMIWLPVSPA